MKNEQSISSVLKGFFSGELGLEMSDITADSSLFKSGMLQSIDFIISVAFIDKEFGIKIPVEFQDYDQMDTNRTNHGDNYSAGK